MDGAYEPAERDRMVAQLGPAVRQLIRQTVRYYDAVADQLGLHLTDLTCLGALRDRRRATASELATELGLTTGAVTRVIDRLHRTGFVRRLPDPSDGRRVIVELIPESEASLVGLFAGQAAHLAESVADMSDEQLRFLLAYLRRQSDFSGREADRLRQEGIPHATRRARPADVPPPAVPDATGADRDTIYRNG